MSSSPWNLFSYLAEFKRLAKMPFGPALLRDWGFNRATLGEKSHGTHKMEAISRIVNLYKDLPFVLVGDDTQKDLIAFGELARKAPERVRAVLIRKASEEPFSDLERQAQGAIEAAGVPLWTGRNFQDSRGFLKAHSLITA